MPAAGRGTRMGGLKKALLSIAGEPLLVHALRPFLARDDVTAIRVAVAPEDLRHPPAWLRTLDPRLGLVAGGRTRTESVRAAIEALPDDVGVIVVHDAVRPLPLPATLDRCVEQAREGRGAVSGLPAVDTLKEVDREGRVLGTPDRARYWLAQTPQAFPADMIRAAYAVAGPNSGATDDATLVERAGGTVVMVEGWSGNVKVTRPEDVALAELLLERARRVEHTP